LLRVRCVPCSLVLKASWSLHLFFGRPMFRLPSGLYVNVCLGSLLVSILYYYYYYYYYILIGFKLHCVYISIRNIVKLLLLAVTSFNVSRGKFQPCATTEIYGAERDYLVISFRNCCTEAREILKCTYFALFDKCL